MIDKIVMNLTYYDGEKPIKTSGGAIILKVTGSDLYNEKAFNILMNKTKKDVADNLRIIKEKY